MLVDSQPLCTRQASTHADAAAVLERVSRSKGYVCYLLVTYRPCNMLVYSGTYKNNNKDNNKNDNDNNRFQRRHSRFFTISSLRSEPFPTHWLKWPGRNRVQITCNTSNAYRVQPVVLRATWYEGTAQLLSLTECKSNLFELYFTG